MKCCGLEGKRRKEKEREDGARISGEFLLPGPHGSELLTPIFFPTKALLVDPVAIFVKRVWRKWLVFMQQRSSSDPKGGKEKAEVKSAVPLVPVAPLHKQHFHVGSRLDIWKGIFNFL